ncbi:17542_t:CDS:2 [Dentiscutata erythropus]|uniref:17542_t:CDS:1 n=1 Tax=Dentiscutata erythropus TaxID=1348616 RepID=A0A9N9B287_9GLOM|nr:17542_t:CDS:2 [Dentiscutata erythropus]
MAGLNRTNTTPESIFQFRENNMYTTEKMKAYSEIENEFKRIQSKHDDEYKELECRHDNERKELKQKHVNEHEKLRNKQHQEIKKLFLRHQNRQPFRKKDKKRTVSCPSTYLTPSGSLGEQQDILTTKQPSKHLSYNACPNNPSGPSRMPSIKSPSQHLLYSSSETSLSLEEWHNDSSIRMCDCDFSIFNEMRYSNNSPSSYLTPFCAHGNPTLISRDGQENSTSNFDMTNVNDGLYIDRVGV